MKHEPGKEIETWVGESADTASPISVVVSSTIPVPLNSAPRVDDTADNNDIMNTSYWTRGGKPASQSVPEAPQMLVAITFRNTKWSAQAAEYRHFGEEVRRLLDAPESCDE